jgi:tetratricopeptide (TPR) repeat protein
MSPEQARGDVRAIDTRTDVHALGVVAYELVTGELPYATDDDSVLGQIRRVCEESPRPFATVRPDRKWDADLETIVRKALEKDPDDRYQGVSELADDLERYLSGQPILARPPSSVYQLRKLIERNKLPATLIGLAALLLVAFSLGMTFLYTQSEANLRRALAAEQEARQTADLVVGVFEINDPSEARGNTVTAREVLDRGAARLTDELAEQPEALARMQHTIGAVYRGLGLYGEAEKALEAAWSSRDRFRRVSGRNEIDADIMNDLGRIQDLTGRLAAAESSYSSALAIKTELFGEGHPKVAVALMNLGTVYRAMARPDTAEVLFRRAERVLARESPMSHEYATSLANLGLVHLDRADFAVADSLLSLCLDVREQIAPRNDPDLATDCYNLAIARRMEGRFGDAAALAERALAIWEEVQGPDHPDLASALVNLAVIYTRVGRDRDAETMLKRALAIQERSLGRDHTDVAATLNSLGRLYSKQGRYAEAFAALERSLGINETVLGPEHPRVATVLNSLGELALGQADLARAEPMLQRALEIRTAVYGADDPHTALPEHNLGLLRRRQGRRVEARSLLEHALATRMATLGPAHGRIVESLTACADLLRELGETARADSLAAQAQAMAVHLEG